MSYVGFRFGQDIKKKRNVRNNNFCQKKWEIPGKKIKILYTLMDFALNDTFKIAVNDIPAHQFFYSNFTLEYSHQKGENTMNVFVNRYFPKIFLSFLQLTHGQNIATHWVDMLQNTRFCVDFSRVDVLQNVWMCDETCGCLPFGCVKKTCGCTTKNVDGSRVERGCSKKACGCAT